MHQRVKRLEQRGLITGYAAALDHTVLGLPLTAFISHHPDRPGASPTTTPTGCAASAEIESCWSVAGEESYILKVRVGTPVDLEDLLARIRAAAGVSTRTTVVLSTPFENRSVT